MEPPIKPDESDCCNSGCNPCILDAYEEELKKYNAGVQKSISELKNCIQKISYTKFKIVEIREVLDPLFIYVFEHVNDDEDDEERAVIYNPGQHFIVKAQLGGYGADFTRPYTPIPLEGLAINQFAIVIKLYPMGDMCRYIRRLNIGDTAIWRGPYGTYQLNHNTSKHLFAIVQGTGVAPIYSIVKHMLEDDTCDTIIKLYYCNRHGGDAIPLRDLIYDLTRYWNFTYEMYLSGADPDNLERKYNEVIHERRMHEDDIVTYLSNKMDETKVLVCGNSVFNTQISQIVGRSGFNVEQMHQF